ncbi:MAG TPA: RNA polymerase sigma-70 factor [Membranihabitans sp.]|nr:RNA polymerase sigma-70 factor [Membranihabitans sp.]
MNDPELIVLFHQYRDKIYGFFVQFLSDQELAADLMQDVFVKMIQGKHNLDKITDMDGYIYQMCRNRAYDHLKKAYRDKEYREYLMSFMNPSSENVLAEAEQKMEAEYYQAVLEESLRLLPDQQRIIFNLSKKEGLSHQKIAELLDLSPMTVRNHLHRALKNIRSTLHPDMELVVLAVGYWLLVSSY